MDGEGPLRGDVRDIFRGQEVTNHVAGDFSNHAAASYKPTDHLYVNIQLAVPQREPDYDKVSAASAG